MSVRFWELEDGMLDVLISAICGSKLAKHLDILDLFTPELSKHSFFDTKFLNIAIHHEMLLFYDGREFFLADFGANVDNAGMTKYDFLELLMKPYKETPGTVYQDENMTREKTAEIAEFLESGEWTVVHQGTIHTEMPKIKAIVKKYEGKKYSVLEFNCMKFIEELKRAIEELYKMETDENVNLPELLKLQRENPRRV